MADLRERYAALARESGDPWVAGRRKLRLVSLSALESALHEAGALAAEECGEECVETSFECMKTCRALAAELRGES